MLARFFSRKRQRGDTIIEVLFAVTVFSLVAVGALSIMNQGTAIAERSLEITLVRDQVDGQVDSLKFLHDSYVSAYTNSVAGKIADNQSGTPAEKWRYIVDQKTMASPTDFTQSPGDCNLAIIAQSGKPFAINPAAMTVLSAAPAQAVVYSKINNTGHAEGLWIEAVGPSLATDGSHTRYVDFYIRACWSSVGQAMPMTIETVVRLYEPV